MYFIFMPKGIPVRYEFEKEKISQVIDAISDNLKRTLKYDKKVELELKLEVKDDKLIVEIWKR